MRQMGLWSTAVEVETAREGRSEREKARVEARPPAPSASPLSRPDGEKTGEPEPSNPHPSSVDQGADEREAAPPERLAEFLLAVVGQPVRLAITDNRRTMMTSKFSGGVLHVRLHHMFLSAPQPVWDALALYLGEADRDGRAGQLLDAYIDSNMHQVRRAVGRLESRGRVHDLQQIFDRLNQAYFHGASKARVTWGRPGSSRYRRSIQLGCYVAADDLIRMHPSLDQSFVPEFYVSWVMFHEMLHEAYGVEEINGRRHVHPPEFVALEQTYPDYERAKAWEERHLPRLLRYRHR